MNKRGQDVFGMSFGVIFSIILIIAIIGVAVFAINHFLGLSNCTKLGLAYKNLQDEVDEAWTSGIYRDTHEIKLPGNIDHICFGDISVQSTGTEEEIRQNIEEFYFGDGTHTVFVNPPEKACDGDLATYKLEHVDIEGFFCFDNTDVIVNLEKGATDSLVKLSD